MTTGHIVVLEPGNPNKRVWFRLSHTAYPDGGLGDVVRDFLATAPEAETAEELGDKLKAFADPVIRWGGLSRGDRDVYGEWRYVVAKSEQGWVLKRLLQNEREVRPGSRLDERHTLWVKNTVGKPAAELKATPALPEEKRFWHQLETSLTAHAEEQERERQIESGEALLGLA